MITYVIKTFCAVNEMKTEIKIYIYIYISISFQEFLILDYVTSLLIQLNL